MSSALAIAGVTAVLRDLLNDGLINHNVSGVLGSTVTVSVLPPDRVVAAGGTESLAAQPVPASGHAEPRAGATKACRRATRPAAAA